MNKHTNVALGVPILLSSLFTTDVFALETYVPASDNSIMAAYTLVVPKTEVASGLLARAVIPPGLDCPMLRVTGGPSSGKPIRMYPRGAISNTFSAFKATTVCEAKMPAGAMIATIGAEKIPARIPTIIKSLGVIGDTGCRMKKTIDQDCDVPELWPLPKIANSLAGQKPDVVLFLGDFFYREFICDNPRTLTCGTSPAPLDANFDYNSTTNPFPKYAFSDSDYGWAADVLIPMKALLQQAPLVIARGNHESCARGGNGFFKYFDPHLGNLQMCAPTPVTDANNQQVIRDGHPQWKTAPELLTDSWTTTFQVGTNRYLRIAVVDSAYGLEFEVGPSTLPGLTAKYQQAADLTSPNIMVNGKAPENWLLMHQPLFGLDCAPDTISIDGKNMFGGDCKWVSETQTASAYGKISHYNLVLSSHIHLAQAVQIPEQPGQLVIGDGGSRLQEAGAPYPATLGYGPLQYPDGKPVAGLPSGYNTYPAPTSIWTERRFGYAITRPLTKDGDWQWTHYTPEGKSFAKCLQSGKEVSCLTTAPE
ncbi:MAG: hypothetical protein RIQ52_1348 [Pseudomonadota bacterium]|jgi:hypothetical protein